MSSDTNNEGSFMININTNLNTDTPLESCQEAPQPAKVHLTRHQLQVRALQQNLAEMLRDKGILCQDYLDTGTCMLIGGECPYAHVEDGKELPIPDAICTFFLNGKCLRNTCKYFHGSKSQIAKLLSIKKTKLQQQHEKGDKSNVVMYRPQDYLPKKRLPTDLSLENVAKLLASSEKGAPQMSPFGGPQPILPFIHPSASMHLQNGNNISVPPKMSMYRGVSQPQQTHSGMIPNTFVGVNHIPQLQQMAAIQQQNAQSQAYMNAYGLMQVPQMPCQPLAAGDMYNVFSPQQSAHQQAAHQQAAHQQAARPQFYISTPHQSHQLPHQIHNPTNMHYAPIAANPGQQSLLYTLPHQQLLNQFGQYQAVSPMQSTDMFAPSGQFGSVIGGGTTVSSVGGIH